MMDWLQPSFISIILNEMVMQLLISLRIILMALISWQMDMPDIIS